MVPELNEELELLREEDPENKVITKIDCADEYSGALMKDGTLYVWGKNDRGQMGVGAGVGIDMIESENTPVMVTVADKEDKVQFVKDFTTGQNTMMIRDTNNKIYKTGLKLDYTPKYLDFFEDFEVTENT